MKPASASIRVPKLCECGCGIPTKPTDRRRKICGYEVGDYQRFVLGHSSRQSIKIENVLARFWSYTKQLENGCIIWTGALQGGGYGAFKTNSKQFPAHKYIYETTVSRVPAGMVLDHLCRNRACVNVKHLRVVTPRQNVLENSESFCAKNALKTHCPKGHEYTTDNAFIKYFNDGPHRICKICRKESWSRDYETRKRRAEEVMR